MTCIFVGFGIWKREHSGLPPRKNTTAPRRIIKMPTAVSVRESRAPGLVILTIISDATTPLLISLSREMTELELDTLPKRKAARGAVVYIVMVIFHHYILSICLSPLLMVCPKLAKKMKPPRILVHTLFTLFKRRSHPVHILLIKRTYLYVNQWIRRREGMKEKNCFAGHFSASAGRFRPSFSLRDSLFPVTLRAKRTAMQAPRHTGMRGKPLHDVANTVNWHRRQS